MGRCPDARALLPGFVEDELSPVERRLVSGHLEICSACRREEAAFRSALGALAVAPRPVHGDLYSGLSAKLDALNARPVFRPRRLQWAGALACLLLAVGVGATVGRSLLAHRGEEPTHPVVAPPTHEPRTSGGGIVQETRDPVEYVRDLQRSQGAGAGDKKLVDDPAPTIDEPPARRNKRTEKVDPNTPFDEVRDSSGRTLKDIENELKRNGFISSAPTHGRQQSVVKQLPSRDQALEFRRERVPGAPEVKVVVEERENKLKVGDTEVKVRRETGYDANGELALIRLSAESAAKPGTEKEFRKEENGEGR